MNRLAHPKQLQSPLALHTARVKYELKKVPGLVVRPEDVWIASSSDLELRRLALDAMNLAPQISR